MEVVLLGRYMEAFRRLEFVLQEAGAEGEGLREKACSIEHLLPDLLFQDIIDLIYIRNKVVHDFTYNPGHDPEEFISHVHEICDYLEKRPTADDEQASCEAESSESNSGDGKSLSPALVANSKKLIGVAFTIILYPLVARLLSFGIGCISAAAALFWWVHPTVSPYYLLLSPIGFCLSVQSEHITGTIYSGSRTYRLGKSRFVTFLNYLNGVGIAALLIRICLYVFG